MITSSLPAVLATSLTIWGHSAFAAPPIITMQWEASSVNVGFHSSIPQACIYSSIGASNTWNAVGADFHLQTAGLGSHPRVSEQTRAFDERNITIEDIESLPENTLMEARIRSELTTGTILNADIYVDRRYIQKTARFPELICTSAESIPTDRFDWESAILHELGHAIGFVEHTDNLGCSLHARLNAGELKRAPCAAEKQEYIRAYGLPFRILGLENVAGPQGVDIPARIFYQANPRFPVRRATRIVQCASGWECDDYNGTFTSQAPSPLAFNFRCTNPEPLPTATFRWLTTLTDADGAVTNGISHTSTCTRPTGAVPNPSTRDASDATNRIIISH